MHRGSKKSLVESLHDRSQKPKSFFNPNIRYAQYLPPDSIDELLPKIIERLEPKFRLHVSNLEEEVSNLRREVNNLKIEVNVLNNRIQNEENKDIPNPKVTTWLRLTKFFKHRSAVSELQEKNIYKDETCFNTYIENVIKHENFQNVPKIIVECVVLIESIIRTNPEEEGIYRASGDHVEIQKIRFKIDENDYDCLRKIQNVHTLAGVIKLFLREIKSPLMKSFEIKTFIGETVTVDKIEGLRSLVKSLPEINRDTLYYFLGHLNRISRMHLPHTTARSLSVSIGPSLFQFTANCQESLLNNVQEHEYLNRCLELMINNCDKIFLVSRPIRISKMSNKLFRCLSCPKIFS